MTDTLKISLTSHVLTLTLHRPARANSFNFEMTNALLEALQQAEADPQTRCVILTGSGTVFSSGQDIHEMEEYGGQISYREHLEKTYNPLILQIWRMGKPVIAAVNGACAGAALGIALACDLRIAHPRAFFVVGFSGIGLAPDSGVSLLLPVHIGLSRAQEYFYSNRPIPAWRAARWGMVNRVGWWNFAGQVQRVAETLSSGAREAFAFGKETFNRAALSNLEDALRFEGEIQDRAGKTEAHQRLVRAFFQRK